MSQTAILWPMIAHVALVFAVYLLLAARRTRAVRDGKAQARDYRLRSTEPDASATAANNLMNQFEAPMLLHLACLALFVTDGVSAVPLALAWLFVALRYLHAWVHVTTNKLKHRSYSFRAGVAVLALLWVWFALHLAGLV